MKKYYRLQPKGKGIDGHYSETSIGDKADGLHVFSSPLEIFRTDAITWLKEEGLEVVEIEAERDWDNHDVEGCCIDPDSSKIVNRFAMEDFCNYLINNRESLGLDDEEIEEANDYVEDNFSV